MTWWLSHVLHLNSLLAGHMLLHKLALLSLANKLSINETYDWAAHWNFNFPWRASKLNSDLSTPVMKWASWGVASTILSFGLPWNRMLSHLFLASRHGKYLSHFCICFSNHQITRTVEVCLSSSEKLRGLYSVEIEGHDAVSLLLNINQKRHGCGSEAALESWIIAYHSTWVMARSVPAQIISCQKQALILLGFLPNPVPFLPLVIAEQSNVSIAMRPPLFWFRPLLVCVRRIKAEKMVMAENILSRASKVSQITALSIHCAGAEFLLLSPGACW